MGDLATERPSASDLTSALTSAGSVAVVLKRAEQQVRNRIQPLLDESDLSLEHWRILASLDEQPGLPMSTLAEAAVVPAATLTRHVDKLVELGYVVRRVDPADRRRAVTALAPRGTTYVARLRDLERDAEADVLATIVSTWK